MSRNGEKKLDFPQRRIHFDSCIKIMPKNGKIWYFISNSFEKGRFLCYSNISKQFSRRNTYVIFPYP